MSSTYERLLSPGKIGNVTTRNRVIKTGAGVMMWHEVPLRRAQGGYDEVVLPERELPHCCRAVLT